MNQSEIDQIVRVQMINNIASQLEAEFHEFRSCCWFRPLSEGIVVNCIK